MLNLLTKTSQCWKFSVVTVSTLCSLATPKVVISATPVTTKLAPWQLFGFSVLVCLSNWLTTLRIERNRHFDMHFLERKNIVFWSISLKFISYGYVDINSIIDWHVTEDKPLPEPIGSHDDQCHAIFASPNLNELTHSRHSPDDMFKWHCSDVTMGAMPSQITRVSIYLTVCSCVDHRKYQRFASLVFVRGIHRSSANSPHTGLLARKMFPPDDVIVDFFWIRTFRFQMIFYWNIFPMTICQHWLRQWLGNYRRQAIVWSYDDPVQFTDAYAPPGLNKLSDDDSEW